MDEFNKMVFVSHTQSVGMAALLSAIVSLEVDVGHIFAVVIVNARLGVGLLFAMTIQVNVVIQWILIRWSPSAFDWYKYSDKSLAAWVLAGEPECLCCKVFFLPMILMSLPTVNFPL